MRNSLEGFYSTDYNILDADGEIKCFLEHKIKTELPVLEREVFDLYDQLNKKSNIPIVSKKAIVKEIDTRLEKISNYREKKEINDYINETCELLDRYKTIKKGKIMVNFGLAEVKVVNSEDCQLNERLRIIESFLEIARRYIQVDVIRNVEKKNECESCGFGFEHLDLDDLEYCPTCFLELDNIVSSQMNENTSLSQYRGNYDDRDNFYKSLLRTEGKQNKQISEDLFDRLDKYFESFRLPLGEEIRALPLNEKGRKDGTNLKMLYHALEKIRYSNYEDANLIANRYWGWKLPDFSEIRDKIMEEYDLTQAAFEHLDTERSSALNTEYRKFKHLQLRGVDVDIKDFKLPITRENLIKYEKIWQQICEKCNLKYIPLF